MCDFHPCVLRMDTGLCIDGPSSTRRYEICYRHVPLFRPSTNSELIHLGYSPSKTLYIEMNSATTLVKLVLVTHQY